MQAQQVLNFMYFHFEIDGVSWLTSASRPGNFLGSWRFWIHAPVLVGIQLVRAFHFPRLHLSRMPTWDARICLHLAISSQGMARFSTIISNDPGGWFLVLPCKREKVDCTASNNHLHCRDLTKRSVTRLEIVEVGNCIIWRSSKPLRAESQGKRKLENRS